MTIQLSELEFDLLAAVGGVLTATALGTVAAQSAPAVGGAWWPYIRVVVTIITAFVGGWVGVFVTLLLMGLAAWMGVIE